MSFFLTLAIIGLVGMLVMALPGLMPHGHAGAEGVHGGQHGLHLGEHAGHNAAAHAQVGLASHGHSVSSDDLFSLTRWIPSPRVVFSLFTLFGAFGYLLNEVAHLKPLGAGLGAIVPAFLMEQFVIKPLWNLMFAFQGQPSSPLTDLTTQEVEAITPFANGRGMVRAIRDGREVQLVATLPVDQRTQPVKVGDKLRVEEVDADKARLTVSLK